MKTNEREILIYYHQESSNDKKVIAHAQSLSKHIKAYDFSKAPSTTSSWQTIINALGIHPKELFDKSKDYYQKNLKDRDFDDRDWLDIIIKNFDLIKSPIAVRGEKAVLCTNSTDVLRLLSPNEVDGRYPEKDEEKF